MDLNAGNGEVMLYIWRRSPIVGGHDPCYGSEM